MDYFSGMCWEFLVNKLGCHKLNKPAKLGDDGY
jgi:hypothetical protein